MADELNLNEFQNFSEEAKEAAKDAIREVLAEKAHEVEEYLKTHSPVGPTGKLHGAVVSVKIEDSDRRIAFRISYDGENEEGIAYQLIANALNRGYFLNNSGKYVAGRHFIDEAVHLLKGLDELIGVRFIIKMGGTSDGDNN